MTIFTLKFTREKSFFISWTSFKIKPMMNKLFIIIFLNLCVVINAQLYPDSNNDGKYYSINGKKIWVVTFGIGNPLVLISGGPGASHFVLRAFDTLSTTSTLIYFDALGRGRSDTASTLSEYTLDRDIEEVEGLRKALNYSKIDVLGHSNGTIVAQGYALKYQNHVSHLVLVAPFDSHVAWQENDDNSNKEIKEQFPEIWDSLMVLRKSGYKSNDSLHYKLYFSIPSTLLYFYDPNFVDTQNENFSNLLNLRLYYQMVGLDGDFLVGNEIGRFDYRDKLKDLRIPVLIIAGRYDRVAVPSMTIKYKKYLSQAEFVMMEKSGHWPFKEEPAKTFRIIRDFLRK